MKTFGKILTALLLSGAALISQSCLKDQAEVFDKPSSTRMEEYLNNAQKVLTSSEKGWRIEYFAGNSQQDHGGINTIVSFTEDKVTATSETDTTVTESSFYKLTTDDGPVLSFDTHNSVLHEYATPAPSGTLYQGQGGDFEFLILEATKEKVVLKGKRSGKISTMYPLAESPKEYLTKILNLSESFVIGELDGTIKGKAVHGELDLDNRQLTMYEIDEKKAKLDSTEVTVPYIYTPTGIKFYNTLALADAEINYFDYDGSTFVLTTKDADVNLKGLVPEDYLTFDFFEGDYTFKFYSGRTYSVNLTKGEGRTYIMTGILKDIPIVLDYITAKGRLHIASQIVGTYNGNSVVMAPWSLSGGGSLYPTALGLGLDFVWNMDREKPVFTFVSDGYMSGFNTDSFILWLVNDSGSSAGAASSCSWFVWGSYQWPYLGDGRSTLTKK